MQKRLFFMLVTAFLASVSPFNPHRSLKVLMMSTWAAGSFVTGLAAFHLDTFHNLRASQTRLRIVSLAFHVAFVLGYIFWFLRGTRQKKRDFVYGTAVCGFLLWIVYRLSLALWSAAGEHETLLWLDMINLSVLTAVVAGILTAESRLLVSQLPHGSLRPPHVQPTSENGANPRFARDIINPSPGESKKNPMAHVSEACSGDQKAPDGDQPDDSPLPTPARRSSPHLAVDTSEEHSSEGSSFELESLSVSEVSEDELIWALDPDDGTSRFIDAAAHRLLEKYRRATIFPPPSEAAISTKSPATHRETPRVTNNPEASRHPHQSRPGPHRKGKRAKKSQGQDSGDEDAQRQQPKKQKTSAPTDGKPTLLLACPFWKLDPQTHDRCFKCILSNPSRVKQHLLRKHSPKFYCQRCYELFPSQETLDQHVQVHVVTCPSHESSFPQITYQQRLRLSTKSKTNLSETDQWFTIWDILFPSHPRPSSPYIDANLSADLCQFREFAEADGPEIIAADMQHSLSMTAMPAEQITAIVRQVISRSITLLFARWSALGRPPLQQPGDAAEPLVTALPSEYLPADSHGAESSSDSIPVVHAGTPTSSVASLDLNATIPGNALQEEPFAALPTYQAQHAETIPAVHGETPTISAPPLNLNAMFPGNAPQEGPFAALPDYEAQDAETSDGFQIQGEDMWQGLWEGWDSFMDLGMSSGVLGGKLDFEVDIGEVEKESDAVNL